MQSPIIGVIDLCDGRAVHAIAGRRTEYRSVIADGVPEGDAIALANRYLHLGVNACYIADLDAIAGKPPNSELLKTLSAIVSEILIDAGAFARDTANLVDSSRKVRFIVPTECFDAASDWADACAKMGRGNAVMGLDLAGNGLRSADARPNDHRAIPSGDLIQNVSPWVQRALEIGVESIVLLDLAYVGTRQGAGTVGACEQVSQRWPTLELISGGGVNDAKDLVTLVDAGCRRVLVGTALHKDESAERLFLVE